VTLRLGNGNSIRSSYSAKKLLNGLEQVRVLAEKLAYAGLPKGHDIMRRKLQRKAGAAVYAARKAIVEPVFGQIKQARGFRLQAVSHARNQKGTRRVGTGLCNAQHFEDVQALLWIK
jgi:hypothetical protein